MEYLDYFDANYHLLGQAEKKEVHLKGLWHRAFHCWIFTSNREVVLQLRSKHIVSNPNVLDISSAGHIQAGEMPIDGGLRELEEELGIKAQEKDLIPLGKLQHAYDTVYSDGAPNMNREFQHVFLFRCDKDLSEYRLQREELDGIYKASLEDLLKLFNGEVRHISVSGYLFDENDRLTPDHREVCRTNFNMELSSDCFRTVFVMIERALDGRKYFGI